MFFSSIAHELRTPMNSIIPISKKLEQEEDNHKKKNYLRIILNSAYHLENIVEDALDMSRLENKKFEIIQELTDIRKVVKDTCSIINFQIQAKNLILNVNLDSSIPDKIETDAKRYK